ncbi:MAG: hypothetical protein C0617_05495 [Desulfuromonas sp.]|nr:MAG: hypothetical protein C0617_05495 [Desulfuromonas sp.]
MAHRETAAALHARFRRGPGPNKRGGTWRRLLPIFLLFIFFLQACVPAPPPPPAVVVPGMETTLLDRLYDYGRAFRSLKGVAKVRVSSGGRTLSGTQVLFAEKPDRLRAETLNPLGFGQSLLQVAASGDKLEVYVPREGRYYEGQATAGNLARFTRLPLQLEDLVRLILYDVPVLPFEETLLSSGEGGYRLSLYGEGEVRQELTYDAGLRLTGSAYFVGKDLQLEVVYEKFSEDRPGFPRVQRLSAPQDGAVASLVFSEALTNVVIPGDRFSLDPPAGIEVRPIP